MKAALKLLGIGAGGVCVVLAMVPWTLRGAAWQSEIVSYVGRVSGLDLRVHGRFTLKLLPRPRVQMTDVSVVDPGRALRLDAPALYGDLDIAALSRGEWRLASATFADPTITMDVDKDPLANLIAGVEGSESAKAASPAFRMAIRSGVVRLRSRSPNFDTLFTDVNITADQAPSADGSLSISGGAVWHAVLGQFTARIGRPRTLLQGGVSSAFLQMTSPVASFSAVGDLTGGTQRQFAGHVSLISGTLPRLLAALNMGPSWIKVQKVSLAGDALARLGDVSLSSSTLRLDDNAFEGTLGFHGDGNHSLVEGTLATNDLDLGSLSDREVDARSARAFLRKPIDTNLISTNVDLRVSASRAHFGKTEIKDAALAAFARDGRVEVTLDEAAVFDGIVKARAVASLGPRGVEAHADVSLSDVDLGPLSTAIVGHDRLTGRLHGKLAVDGRGAALTDIVQSLSGDGQVTMENGTFMGVSVTQALKRFTRHLPMSSDPAGQITAFESASAAIRIEQGVAKLVDGKVKGPGMQLSFGGRTDLPHGKLDITAVAAQTDASGSLIPDGPSLPLEMRGSWGEPLTLIERQTRALALPALSVPLFESGQEIP